MEPHNEEVDFRLTTDLFQYHVLRAVTWLLILILIGVPVGEAFSLPTPRLEPIPGIVLCPCLFVRGAWILKSVRTLKCRPNSIKAGSLSGFPGPRVVRIAPSLVAISMEYLSHDAQSSGDCCKKLFGLQECAPSSSFHSSPAQDPHRATTC